MNKIVGGLFQYCLHEWSKWSRPISTWNSAHKQQWRGCKQCGKAQFRTLLWDKQTNIETINKALDEVNPIYSKGSENEE